jgi:hypothetical protein
MLVQYGICQFRIFLDALLRKKKMPSSHLRSFMFKGCQTAQIVWLPCREFRSGTVSGQDRLSWFVLAWHCIQSVPTSLRPQGMALLPISMLDRIMMVPWVRKACSQPGASPWRFFPHTRGKILSPTCVSHFGSSPNRRFRPSRLVANYGAQNSYEDPAIAISQGSSNVTRDALGYVTVTSGGDEPRMAKSRCPNKDLVAPGYSTTASLRTTVQCAFGYQRFYGTMRDLNDLRWPATGM